MKKILLFLIILFCFKCGANAQEQFIEVQPDLLLKQILRKDKPEKEHLYLLAAYINAMAWSPEQNDTLIRRIPELLKLNFRLNLLAARPYQLMYQGAVYFRQNRFETSVEEFKKAISEFDKQKLIMGSLSILSSIQLLYNITGKHEERLKFYKDKLNYYLINGPKENLAACYHGVAGYYYFKTDYNQAITYYLKSYEVFKGFSPVGEGNELSVIGSVYYSWGNWQRGLYYLYKADSVQKKLHDPGNVYSLTSIAQILLSQGKSDDALKYISRAGELATLARSGYDKAILAINAADIYLKLGLHEKALLQLERARKLADSLHLQIDGAQGQLEIDYCFYEYFSFRKDPVLCGSYLLSAYHKALDLNVNALVLKYQKELSLFYKRTGNFLKSSLYAEEFFRLNDSLYKARNVNNIAIYEMESAGKQKEWQIQGLLKRQVADNRNFLIGGAFLLLIILGSFSRIRYIAKTKKQLEQKNTEIANEKDFAEQMRLRAEQSEKIEQQFLANMSHEIRTPMNAVMGMTNLLIDKNPNNDQRQYLDIIKHSSTSLLHLINDILDLSKIEAGKIELENIDFSLRQLLGQVEQTLQYKAEEKGLQLFTEVDKDLPDILIGDPVRLNQVLINLSGNAIKFTETGSVKISVQHITGNDSSAVRCRFSIADTGIGIPGDKLETVFESFSQASASDTRKYGGTGLGLTISKQLVELMNGRITVESEMGSGTTFSFEVNFATGSAERMQKRISSELNIDGTILNGLSVLVADDNEYNRIVAADTLQSKADVTVTMAANGRDAVELFGKNHYDVILMDVRMPVMDGFEATRIIRNQFSPPQKDVPIIALTASVLGTELDACRQAGMNLHIVKPYTSSQLIRGIAEAAGISIVSIGQNNAEHSARQESPLIAKGITDLSYLEKFCDGDHGRMKKYIGIFLETADGLIGKLNTALLAGDFYEIASQVHAFKTKWIMMGMTETNNIALNIEKQCREQPVFPEIKGNIELLILHINTAITELKQM